MSGLEIYKDKIYEQIEQSKIELNSYVSRNSKYSANCDFYEKNKLIFISKRREYLFEILRFLIFLILLIVTHFSIIENLHTTEDIRHLVEISAFIILFFMTYIPISWMIEGRYFPLKIFDAENKEIGKLNFNWNKKKFYFKKGKNEVITIDYSQNKINQIKGDDLSIFLIEKAKNKNFIPKVDFIIIDEVTYNGTYFQKGKKTDSKFYFNNDAEINSLVVFLFFSTIILKNYIDTSDV